MIIDDNGKIISNLRSDIMRYSIENKKTTLRSILAKQRFNMARHIDGIFPEALAQEAKALLIGIQDGLDPELQFLVFMLPF